MKTPDPIDAAAVAAQLLQEHRQGKSFSPVRAAGELLPLDAAYAVQRQYVAQRAGQAGAQVAGYKIGLTSAAMREMCGIAHPVYGSIARAVVLASGAQVALAGYGRLGIEFEIAVRMGRDLVPAGPTASAEEARQAVDAVAAALELVDDRNADYAQLDAGSLVADNAWNAAVVLGAWVPVPAELADLRGVLRSGGQTADEGEVGSGDDSPFASVAWLAGELKRRGGALRKGDIVMTGSIVRTRFAQAGQSWDFEVDGLGAVSVSVRA
jgi:2-keto-4-pentenoate hydratase